MRAQIVAMTSENLDMDAIKRAGDILKAGGLHFRRRRFTGSVETRWIHRLP